MYYSFLTLPAIARPDDTPWRARHGSGRHWPRLVDRSLDDWSNLDRVCLLHGGGHWRGIVLLGEYRRLDLGEMGVLAIRYFYLSHF